MLPSTSPVAELHFPEKRVRGSTMAGWEKVKGISWSVTGRVHYNSLPAADKIRNESHINPHTIVPVPCYFLKNFFRMSASADRTESM